MDQIKRRDFMVAAGVGAATFGLEASLHAAQPTSAGAGSGKKPNVLIIFCDQLRSFALGCYGNPFVKTPNIDRLAQNGFRFEHGISNNPVCVPARSILLSGQYSRTCVGSRSNEVAAGTGLLGRDDRLKFKDPTIAEEFKKLGYKTALIGKWHVDTRPSRFGFDESFIPGSIFTAGEFTENEGKAHRVTGFTTDHEITRAKKYFAENRNSEQPFFLYYNIISPHMPLLDVPYKYSHMYDPKAVPLRDNVWQNGALPSDEMWFNIYMWQTHYNKNNQPITAKATPDFTLRDLTSLYYGAVTWVDDTVGEILESLKENGHEKDTLIVFTSDHGDMLGSHHMWNKDRLYEEAIHVPMIYRWPGEIRPGENSKQVAALIDVMPTLLDLCGGTIPSSVQGQSLTPVLQGKKNRLEQDYTFIETSLRATAIRTPTHMYGVLMNKEDTAIEDDRYQFFDLEADPYELNNLAKSGKSSSLADQLRAKVVEWDRETPRLAGLKYGPWAPGA